MKASHVVRPANRADITALYGDLPFTARAWVAERDGEVVGVAGYYVDIGGFPVVFSKVLGPMGRMAIAREARRMMARFKSTCFCVAQPGDEGAPRFLEWLGWRHWASTDDGEVYIWQTQ